MPDPAQGAPALDGAELRLLTEVLRAAMSATTGVELDRALDELGWLDMLAESPAPAIQTVFRLLGETGSHASVLVDVLRAADPGLPADVALPFAGGRRVIWERSRTLRPHGAASPHPGSSIDEELPLRIIDREATRVESPHDTAAADETADSIASVPLAAGRRALGWWLLGSGHAMLSLARTHALERLQFGRPLASFQAVRHRLAETLVALDGAEAALAHADGEFGALLAKAAAGRAATTAARHCQQVLGGIGFTAEHELHRHVRRVLVLDGLLGSTRELVREAGTEVRRRAEGPRLANL
ncbi:acyl-CoA dehydrogenase family protein [Nocardia shimofusensis]|uniref:acyl-CoA dehydrogenase family protein n=1 Tax=Nocardia shimofusensis TaxID=228596 RepID=UPI00082D38B0|nr:acyl-CoA dehydrogenase family protein [Nocardia shimofusensis]